jgi:carbon storage regulator
MIGDDVEITVVDIRGDKVRLGITAPRQIQVHRKEVYDAIKRENQQAAHLSKHDVADVVDRAAAKNRPEKTSHEAADEKPQKDLDGGKERDDPHRPNQVGRSR